MNKKRNLLLTILVVVAAFTANLLTANIFNGLANSYLIDFLLKVKASVLALLAAVILKKLWIYRRFDPVLLKKGWAGAIPDLIFSFILFVNFFSNSFHLGQRPTAGPTDIVLFCLTMLLVGFHEETLFRGLIQNAFHEFFDEDTVGHVLLAAVYSGILFGAFHLTNATRPGVSFSDAVIQALGACGAGIFYCAIYFRTGKNLWYNMLVHALHDAGIFLSQGGLNGMDSSAVISGASRGNSTLTAILQGAVYAAIGLFLLRKKKVEPLLKKTETEAEEEA